MACGQVYTMCAIAKIAWYQGGSQCLKSASIMLESQWIIGRNALLQPLEH